MSHHVNLVRIKSVYNALEELNEMVAFVGGTPLQNIDIYRCRFQYCALATISISCSTSIDFAAAAFRRFS